jgi:glycosyltransferase involved in cell wall biosynthesis
MDSLSILHVTAPGRVGGLESVVRGLASGHAARGHRLAVFASTPDQAADHPFLAGLRAAGVQVYAPRLSTRSYFRERAAIREAMLTSRANIVHTHGYRSDVVGLTAAAGKPVRTVTTVHGFTGGDWKNRLYEHFQLRAFRKFAAVVAVSRPLAERIIVSGVATSRVRLIPNAFGGTSPVDRANARKVLGIQQDEFVIGWVGRVTHEKGLDVMLGALHQLTDLPVTLLVIGEGREREVLARKAVASGLEGRIRWLGVVPECARYFSAFDLYALSSHTEGTPITLLEAMQAGVPVVTTSVGGVPDVVSEAEAWLTPAGDTTRLAAAIRQAWSNPEDRRNRSAAASRRLAEHFSPATWLDRYEDLYRELLATGRDV